MYVYMMYDKLCVIRYQISEFAKYDIVIDYNIMIIM